MEANNKATQQKRTVVVKGKKYVILRRMWRICTNRHSNDWNDEPEYIAVPYEILEEKRRRYACIRAGWRQLNILPKREFFSSKEDCEKEIRRRANGESAGNPWMQRGRIDTEGD